MRRSLRRIGAREVKVYSETEQLFTTESLEDAKQRLAIAGRELSHHCFFSWVQTGTRYFRVWEDKRLQSNIAQPVPAGEVAAVLKRADAEKLYIKAKRYKGTTLRFATEVGHLHIQDAATGEVKAALSLPVTGGELVFEPAGWSTRQAAHFVNVLLIRDRTVDEAYAEADTLR
ncbi:MAG TPA: hypothetical protein VD902_09260 [Symbiobacteriaceae bacterium]|nr:hypothetical protein [Symbiobacteriaceae bacterium]